MSTAALALALAVLPAATPKSPRAVDRPSGVVTMPAPRTSLPRLRGFVEAFTKPKELERDIASLGLDPFDPDALEAAGVDLSKPFYAFLPAHSEDPLVAELAVAKADLTDQALARAGKSKKGAHPLAGEMAKAGPGLYVGPADHPLLVVQRRDTRLFVQAARERSEGAASLAAIAGAEAATHPKNVPELSKKRDTPADLWLISDGAEGVDRVEGAAWLATGKLELAVRVWLDFASGLILGDLASSAGPARRLLPEAGDETRAGELLLRVGRAGIADVLEASKLQGGLASALTGELHAVLTRGGSVLGAAAIDSAATKAQLDELVRAIEKAAGNGKAERGGKGREPSGEPKVKIVARGNDKLLTVFLAGKDGAEAEKVLASTKVSSRPSPSTPIDAWLFPTKLLDGLEERARSKNGPPVSRARVLGARVATEDAAAALKNVHVELALPPGFVEGTVTFEYEPKPKASERKR